MVRAAMILFSAAMFVMIGCADVKVDVPDFGGSSRPEVDSSQVPKTRTHAECRDELIRAYEEIRYQKDRVARRDDKIRDLEDDKDELEDEVERLEKRLERYEDD